ncbi:unconventional myosin-Ie-like isoform X1 [Octopus vulgaris]|uniref:Unconventional myosin-Ie-like isoform X1 n=1 Tax=Octopus vulgaris TaxID=6645 RepID=A0AA36BC98_OCTVU|nr:unconventional myosin-Ie-like isoform X1 [Octopus vulgaris]
MEVTKNKPRNKHIPKSSGRPPPPSSKPPMHKPAPPSSKPPVHAMKGGSKKIGISDVQKPLKPKKLINNNFMDSAPNGSQKTTAEEIQNRPQRPRNPPPSSRPQKPKPQMKPPPKPDLPKCRCLYRYDPQNTDELAFDEGDIIEIIHEDPCGWWKGKLRGRIGLFPLNYIERM